MGDVSLRNVEIEKLKPSLQRMEENKLKANNAYISEVQKNFRLTKQVEKNADESTSAQTLAQSKEKIWIDINSLIS